MKSHLLVIAVVLFLFFGNESKAQCTVFTNVVNSSACGITAVATGIGSSTYTWDFGDASTGTGNTVTHTYAANGIYNVCCIGYDLSGNACDTFCSPVTISGCNSSSSCTVVGTQIATGTCSFTFIASGSGAVTYGWDFGDAQTGSGPTVSHTYSANGTYTVCVVGYDSSGFPCDTFCQTATATGCSTSSSCTIVGTQIPNGPCSFTFIANGIGVTNYSWTFGDSGTGMGPTVQHTYAANGTYNVCVVGYDSSMVPCDTFCMVVTVTNCSSSTCTVIATQIPMNACTVQFIATGIGVTTYAWNFGDTQTGTGATISHTYTTNGTYNVCCVGYDASGAPCDTACIVTVITGCVNGVAEYSNTEISLFPNPVNTVLNVKVDQNIVTNWRMTDISGREVSNGSINASAFAIDMTAHAEGLYFVLFYDFEGSLIGVKEVVKE